MNRITKIVASVAVAAVATVGLTACTSGSKSAKNKDQKSSAQILIKLDGSQPVPQFDWSQIRQTLIDAETAQAQTTQTTSFFFVLGVKDPVFVCPSIGYPVPETDQITNPEQQNSYNGNPYTLPQIDPNGIYGGNTAATFVICVGDNGSKYLEHAEEDVHTVSGPAVWDSVNHSIKITGPSTAVVKTHK
jgi:hypothetical protein